MRIRVALPPWLRSFFSTAPVDVLAPDDASIDRAKAAQRHECFVNNVDEDGHVRRQTGLSEILRASQASAKVVHFAERRRQKLAAALTEECAPITGGPAFTFKQGGK